MNPNEVIAVNEKDEVIGYVEKMEAHRKGILHRAISVLVFNDKNEWLLQQRAAHKYHSGLLWSNTSCTHPMQNEEVLDAAHRRLREEMGMESELEKKFSFTYKAHLDDNMIEHELDHVFFGVSNSIPDINREEVASYRYVSTEDLQTEITMFPDQFTEWFKMLFERVKAELS